MLYGTLDAFPPDVISESGIRKTTLSELHPYARCRHAADTAGLLSALDEL